MYSTAYLFTQIYYPSTTHIYRALQLFTPLSPNFLCMGRNFPLQCQSTPQTARNIMNAHFYPVFACPKQRTYFCEHAETKGRRAMFPSCVRRREVANTHAHQCNIQKAAEQNAAFNLVVVRASRTGNTCGICNDTFLIQGASSVRESTDGERINRKGRWRKAALRGGWEVTDIPVGYINTLAKCAALSRHPVHLFQTPIIFSSCFILWWKQAPQHAGLFPPATRRCVKCVVFCFTLPW
jgi:hypothetical protein